MARFRGEDQLEESASTAVGGRASHGVELCHRGRWVGVRKEKAVGLRRSFSKVISFSCKESLREKGLPSNYRLLIFLISMLFLKYVI